VTCFRERARDRLKFRELRIHVRRAKIFEDSFRYLQVSDERLGEKIHVEYDADSGIDWAAKLSPERRERPLKGELRDLQRAPLQGIDFRAHGKCRDRRCERAISCSGEDRDVTPIQLTCLLQSKRESPDGKSE
jgi:hypothetical protein